MSTVSGSFERVEEIPTAPVKMDILPMEFILWCSITATLVWMILRRLKRQT